MKFDREDNENCRVYYTEHRRLFCWQIAGHASEPVRFDFLICTRDGEPSHEVEPPADMPQCPGESRVGRELNEYLARRRSAA